MFGVGAFIIIHEGCLRIQLFYHHSPLWIVRMQTLGGSLGAAEAEKLIPTLVGQFRHLSLAAGPEHFQLARTLLSQIETSMDIV